MPTYSQSTRPLEGFLKIVELFETVQGEGKFVGVPSVFLRTGMCNLECAGCDTKWDKWTESSHAELAATIIDKWKSKHLVLTGGEPTLWQKQLAEFLTVLDTSAGFGPNEHNWPYTVTVETNGAVPLRDESFIDRVNLFSFSPKVGTLGRGEKFNWHTVFDNIDKTRGKNQLKYVLDPNEPEDVDRIFQFHSEIEHMISDEFVYFQPYDTETLVNIFHPPGLDDVYGYLRRFAALTKLVTERSAGRFRVLPQLHKLLSWR